jgi:hypothetical protein
MRFFALTAIVAAVAVLFVSAPAAATPSAIVARTLSGTTYSSADHYGSPIPPWEAGAKPGWYYGKNPAVVSQLGLDLIYLADSVGFISSASLCPSIFLILPGTNLYLYETFLGYIDHLSPPRSLAPRLPQVPKGKALPKAPQSPQYPILPGMEHDHV